MSHQCRSDLPLSQCAQGATSHQLGCPQGQQPAPVLTCSSPGQGQRRFGSAVRAVLSISEICTKDKQEQ